MTCYFTSITANYFAKARTLGQSLKKYNPQAKFVVVCSDPLPQWVDPSQEPMDEILYSRDFSAIDNVKAFFFKHTITELCTAVKPMAALEILDRFQADSVVYLDPDIAVFNSLQELEAMFQDNSILLTPHQTTPETQDYFIRNNEILFLKRGSYNCGFFGAKNDAEGRRFLNWWNQRLLTYCFDDNYDLLPELSRDGLLGMFTDQKWTDLVPSFFDGVKIIKEPGYNVCTWNLSQRTLKIRGEDITVEGKPLYFFHFSGFDSGGHRNELNNILKVKPENADVPQLSDWYEKTLAENGQETFGKIAFDWTRYSNGEKIQDFERKLYHIRKDIHALPPFCDPFTVTDGECFYTWVRREYPQWFNHFAKKGKQEQQLNHFRKMANVFLPQGSRAREVVKGLYHKMKRSV